MPPRWQPPDIALTAATRWRGTLFGVPGPARVGGGGDPVAGGRIVFGPGLLYAARPPEPFPESGRGLGAAASGNPGEAQSWVA